MYFIHAVGRQFPDKAIDLIDEACTSVEEKSKAIVGPDLIARVGGVLVMPFSTNLVIEDRS